MGLLTIDCLVSEILGNVIISVNDSDSPPFFFFFFLLPVNASIS